ncbi:MAG: FAD-dependent oxidoreductase, partial [Cyanobacteria bacterium J06623_4]
MSTSDNITSDILVVGGGTGGAAAAIQAARRGADRGTQVVIVSELPWLGGMLTSAGVSAPDGNELAAFQTGLWGAFLSELRQRHPEGLDHGWVSFFTYNPAVGAQIFADWAAALPNLRWIAGQKPRAVLRQGDRITGVAFDQVTVHASIVLDGTELGDVLALGEVPYRWGWETRDVWDEPSAPVSLSDPADPLYAITQRYPVQSPTWVVIMQDFAEVGAPPIELPPNVSTDAELADDFAGAWQNYGDSDTPAGEMCLNYGRLPDRRFMINWPHRGNDYGVGLQRLVESDTARAQYGQEARWHSQAFARYIQTQLGDRYGLAQDIFPATANSPGGGFALMPYYRESRRMVGTVTVSERDILPAEGGQCAALPTDAAGQVSSIAIGNYPNDHHYPDFEMPLAPKSIHWGGRWTGTPFTIPYGALVPEKGEGLLACEKNISVSHIANGATRLQPVVLGIGQAAGMAAALCIEQRCTPRELDVRSLQTALIDEPTAPAAVIPLFNVTPEKETWAETQKFYVENDTKYSKSGYHPLATDKTPVKVPRLNTPQLLSLQGEFIKIPKGKYQLYQNTIEVLPNSVNLVTVTSEITETFSKLSNGQQVNLLGTWNSAGKWLLC